MVSLAGQIGLRFQQKCYLYFKGGYVGYLKKYCILGKPWQTGTKGPCATGGRTQILIGIETAAGKGGWGQTRRKQQYQWQSSNSHRSPGYSSCSGGTSPTGSVPLPAAGFRFSLESRQSLLCIHSTGWILEMWEGTLVACYKRSGSPYWN